MNAADVVRIVWRRRLVALVTFIVVVGSAFVFVSQQPEVYESRATLAFLPDPANNDALPFYLGALEGLLPTYAQFVTSRTFLEGVASSLPFETTGAELQGEVAARPSSGSGVLRIEVRSSDPERAQAIAAASSEAFLATVEGNGIFTVRLIDEARVPDGAVSPRPRLVIGASVVVGLLLAAAAALAWDRLFGRIQEPRDLADVPGVAVAGVLPEERQLTGPGIVLGDPTRARLEESIRTVATNVVFAMPEEGGSLLFAGLEPDAGSSTLAANLAVVAGELGISTLVIDADLRHPVQHEIFGVRPDIGFTSLLLQGVEPVQVAQPSAFPNVSVVAAGPPLRTRAQELALYLEYVDRFAGLAQLVLVDGPPLRSGDDVRLLAASCERVLVLVRAGSTSPRRLQAAVKGLEAVEASVLGVVLARARESADLDVPLGPSGRG